MAATISEKNILHKKARKKYLSSALAHQLCKVDPQYKPYAISTACCDILTVDKIDGNNTLRSAFYCKRRWCSTCASIMGATMINKYLPVFENIQRSEKLYFVTLTRPTVPANQICDRLSEMSKAWTKIRNLAKKRAIDFRGLRKLELKVSAGNENLYHPHYHIIVVGEGSAEFIVDRWLTINKDANIKSQHITVVENLENGLLELLKYSTKVTAADKNGEIQIVPAWKLDVIYKALAGKRIFRSFGNIGADIEEDFDEQKLTADTIEAARGIYKWQGVDWYHTDYGHALSNWHPTAEEMALQVWRPGKISKEVADEI